MDALFEVKRALHSLLGSEAWNVVALLGEANILLPASALIALLLWCRNARRGGLFFLAAVVLCAAVVVAMKSSIGDFRWTVLGHTFNAKGFPSGHVAMATVFWGGLALIVQRGYAPLLLAPIPLVAIAVLVMHWHHTLDLAAGFAIGAACLYLMALGRRLSNGAEEMLEGAFNWRRRSPRSAF
jgi:undecaprenyl-diphosphatase